MFNSLSFEDPSVHYTDEDEEELSGLYIDDQDLYSNQFYDVHDEGSQSDQEINNEEIHDFLDQSRIFNINEVKSFVEELSCAICCHIIINPMSCQQCESIFCQRCIQEWFANKLRPVCPCCRSSARQDILYFQPHNDEIMTSKVPKILKTLLGKLLLTCINKNEGCEEIITYDFRSKHEQEYCQYSIISCDNFGCDDLMYRKNMVEHLTECSYGLVDCRYCQEQHPRNYIDIHLSECDYRLILCVWCRDKYAFLDFHKHEQECNFRKVNCDHCQKEFSLVDMKQHTPLVCLRTQKDQYKEQIQNVMNEMQEFKLKQKLMEEELEKFKNLYFQAENQKKYLQQQLDEQSKQQSIEHYNQSTTKSNEYQEDFEEEIIEEDIQIDNSQDIDEQNQEQNQFKLETIPFQSKILSYIDTLDNTQEPDISTMFKQLD